MNLESEFKKPGTRNQEPETRNQKPGTRNQKPGTPIPQKKDHPFQSSLPLK